MTLNQFSLPLGAGTRRRDRGMATALSRFALGEIHAAITLVASRRATFTSEEVLEVLGPSVRLQLSARPNAMGAAMHAAAREGLIEVTGQMIPATRREARKRKIALWRMKRSGA